MIIPRSPYIRCRAEAKDFSSNLCVQTSSVAHPVFYPMGTVDSFPGVMRGLGVTLTTHPIWCRGIQDE
jgi:hypothetical protein